MGAVRETLARALGGELPITVLTRMQVHLDDRLLTSRVLNEALVCAGSPAATSRYLIEHRGALEDQKSSGLWIGPAAGSTAAQRSAGGRVLPLRSNKLQFVVREPYTPAGQSLALTRGLVAPNERLRVIMKSTDGHLYVDGPHEVHRVTIGETLVFSASPEPLRLVGVRSRRGWRVRGGGR
jgi:NAD+ kinase